ncbi:hypothetical protein FIBSPDRAFT_932755 [Athelia psychrophila]|uniref:Uncharacterized protein n=1 Tax=Athelia psychrophila TaxID=1759441 RepID=A0A166ICC9_9AGAM|nr:hypothetical protein FIBSPDRAFT_932755 [Fibularhizoctonia sp. CBS 109695]
MGVKRIFGSYIPFECFVKIKVLEELDVVFVDDWFLFVEREFFEKEEVPVDVLECLGDAKRRKRISVWSVKSGIPVFFNAKFGIVHAALWTQFWERGKCSDVGSGFIVPPTNGRRKYWGSKSLRGRWLAWEEKPLCKWEWIALFRSREGVMRPN